MPKSSVTFKAKARPFAYLDVENWDKYWHIKEMLSHIYDINPRAIGFGQQPDPLECEIILSDKVCPATSDFLIASPHKKFNLKFSSHQKVSQIAYSNVPRGSLNVERLLANKPCFATPHPQQKEKKQSILFDDWSASEWTRNRSVQITKLADELIQDGYPVYACQNGQIIKVKSGALLVEMLKQNKEMQMVSEDALVSAASKQKIPRDQLHILDYHQLNTLLDGASSENKTLEAGNWWHNLDQYSLNLLLPKLKLVQPPFEFVVGNTYPDDESMIEKLSEELNIPMVWRIRTLNLDADLIRDLVSANATPDSFYSDRFKQVESLLYHPDKGSKLPDHFGSTLQSFEALKYLSIEKAEGTNQLSSIAEIPTLEMLNLSGSDINNETLEALLIKNKNLKHIALDGCKNIHWESLNLELFASIESLSADMNAKLPELLESARQLKTLNLLAPDPEMPAISRPLNLQHVERLTLFGGSVSSEDLKNILNGAPKLNYLDLATININGELTKDISLPTLETLILKKSSITSDNLSALLAESPLLKTLDISFCQNITGDISCGSLQKLEECLASNSAITSESLKALLVNAKNLKKLEIKNLKKISDNFASPPYPKLDMLEELQVFDSVINSRNFNTMLVNTKHLKKASISNCRDIIDTLSSDPWPVLGELEELQVLDSSIKSSNLNAFLVNPKNLKILEINGCRQITDNICCGRLKNLETLNISNSSISNGSLTTLLLNTRNLKKLKLYNCSNITADFPCDALQKLTKLEEVNVYDCAITSKMFSTLLSDAKHLKILDIGSCNNINEDISCGHLPKLETLKAYASNISSKSLTALLVNAKHLKKLTLDRCNNINHDFYCDPELKLEVLDIFRSSITNSSLSALLVNATRLKKLEISECPNITFTDDFSFRTLPALETLGLEECPISSKKLSALLMNAKNLKKLNISGCKNITDDIVCDTLWKLETLILGDSQISVNSLANILKQAPRLLRLDLRFAPQFAEDKLPDELKKLLEGRKVLYPQPRLSSQHTVIDLPLSLSSSSSASASSSSPSASSSSPSASSSSPSASSSSPSASRAETAAQTISASNPKKQAVDADTTFRRDKVLPARRIFYPLARGVKEPPVNHYRLQIFHETEVTNDACDINNAFVLAKTAAPTYRPVACKRLSSIKQLQDLRLQHNPIPSFLGVQTLNLGADWQPLASLHAREDLTHLYTIPGDADIELACLDDDNQYYIRSKGAPQPITINFVVREKEPQGPAAVLPQGVRDLQKEMQSWGMGALKGVNKNWTGKDYLDALRTQKSGACRHRAIAFKAAMQEQYPDIPVRVITNDVHAFAEVCIEGQWLTLDFGGYPADMRIDDSNRPKFDSDDYKSREETVFEEVFLDESGQETVIPSQASDAREFERYLATWQRQASTPSSLSAYCQQKVQINEFKKRLVELPSDATLQGLRYALQTHCQHINRDVFYVHSPEDLVCQAPFIRLKADGSNEGTSCKGPGGPLYNFLMKEYSRDNPPVIIINYSNFSADDLVRFNALLDDARAADGVAIPEEALIIGLVNTKKPDRYTGSDFYSRFALQVETCPLSEHELTSVIPETGFDDRVDESAVTINLFHAADWKERLLGRWILQGEQLFFEEGELVRALQNNKSIVIANGLWDDPDFERFWREARLQQSIPCAGGLLPFASDIHLQKQEGYNWEELVKNVSINSGMIADAIICNPQQLPQLFRQYECRNAGLHTLPGLLEAHRGQSLDLNLTRELSDDEWAECLSAAKHYQVHLNIHVVPAITLPNFLSQPSAATSSSSSEPDVPVALQREWQLTDTGPVTIVNSNDPDTSIALLTRQAPEEWLVLDVSEWTASDLTTSLTGQFDPEKLRFVFSEKISAVERALGDGKSILLTGQISPELADALAVVIHRQQKAITGRLMVITGDAAPLAFTQPDKHTVTPEQKRAILELHDEELPRIGGQDDLENESLNVLQTRLKAIRNHPEQSFNKAWEGMFDLPGQITLPPFNPQTSEQDAIDFNRRRLQQVNNALEQSRYVFLTGLTGVGKTTFVNKYLAQQAKIYQGDNALEEAIKDPHAGRKIIYVTEANLNLRQWSEYEALFHKPGTLLLNGELITLPDNISLVFDGNPLSYGDDRNLASLFARHGGALIFDPLPLANIYEEILKPVFENTPLQERANVFCQPMLEVYRFICEQAVDEVLITPRELQMMALLFVARMDDFPSYSKEALARYYAWDIARHTLPDTLRDRFDAQFKPQRFPPFNQQPVGEHFHITPSRQPLITALDNLIALDDFRHSLHSADTPAKLYGGLGGIIVEGEPGIGKSELIIQYLNARGYHRRDLNDTHEPTDKDYYIIPVSMSLDERVKALLKAFDEGAKVMIDEINSSPMLEKLCNGLLMGTGPEGQRPKKPGFMIIGTQNPITMAGRQAQSTALSRRMITVNLPNYPRNEIVHILHASTGVPHETADLMAGAYEKNLAFAKSMRLAPLPCFRDLLNLAKNTARTRHWTAPASDSVSSLLPPVSSDPIPRVQTVRPNDVSDRAKELVARYYKSSGQNILTFTPHEILKGEYKKACEGLSDVALKTRILEIFTQKLLNAEAQEDFGDIIAQLHDEGAYQALARGQGFATRFFSIKTSALTAIEPIINQVAKDHGWNLDASQSLSRKP